MGRVEKKIRGTPQTALFSATAGCFAGMTCIALFGPAMHLLKDKLQLSPMEAAYLIASPVASGSLMRIVFGALADATGAVMPFSALLALSTCGVFGTAALLQQLSAGDKDAVGGPIESSIRLLSEAAAEGEGPAPGLYSGLIALGVLAGFGIATFSVGVGQIAYWWPKNSQGSVLGLYGGLICAAPGLWTMLLPHMLERFGLAVTYYCWGALLIAVSLVYVAVARNSRFFQLRKLGLSKEEAHEKAHELGQELFPADNAIQGVRTAAGVWKTWALVCLYFSTFGGMVSLTGWFPTYWHEVHDVKPTTAGSLTALYSMGFAAVRASSGPVSDRLGGELALAIALSTMMGGALLIVFSRSFTVDLVGEVMLAIGSGVSTNAVFKLLPQEVPQAVGGAAGLVGGLGAFGGFVLTPCLAYFAKLAGEDSKKDGYSRGFLIFAFLALANLGVTLALKMTATGHVKHDEKHHHHGHHHHGHHHGEKKEESSASSEYSDSESSYSSDSWSSEEAMKM